MFNELVEQFKATHSGFLGIKLIYAIHRNVDIEGMMAKLDKFQKLRLVRALGAFMNFQRKIIKLLLKFPERNLGG